MIKNHTTEVGGIHSERGERKPSGPRKEKGIRMVVVNMQEKGNAERRPSQNQLCKTRPEKKTREGGEKYF